MKNSLILSLVLGVLVSGLGGYQAGAADVNGAAPILAPELAGLSLSESLAKSVACVTEADASVRDQVTADVLRNFVRSHPLELAQLVKTVSAKCPLQAGAAAGTAVVLQPDQIAAITTAAVSAAPNQTRDVVEGILSRFPANWFQVSDAALKAAPDQADAVVRAVSVTEVTLRPYLADTLAGTTVISASAARELLNRASLASTGRLMRDKQAPGNILVASKTQTGLSAGTVSGLDKSGSANGGTFSTMNATPVFGPPPVPLPVIPVEIGVGQGTGQTSGGRNYSGP